MPELSNVHVCCIVVIIVLLLIFFNFKSKCKSTTSVVENFRQKLENLQSTLVFGADPPSGTGVCFDNLDTKNFNDTLISLREALNQELTNIGNILGITSTEYTSSKSLYDAISTKIDKLITSLDIGDQKFYLINGKFSCNDYCTARNIISIYKSSYDSVNKICSCPVGSFPVLKNGLVECDPTSDATMLFNSIRSDLDGKIDAPSNKVFSNVTYNCGGSSCSTGALIQPDPITFTSLTLTFPNNFRINATKSHFMILQQDGNLVVYKGVKLDSTGIPILPTSVTEGVSRGVWSTGTSNIGTVPSDLTFGFNSLDGNLLTVGSLKDFKTYWNNGIRPGKDAKLFFENDGSITVVDSTGKIRWNSRLDSNSIIIGQLRQKTTGRISVPDGFANVSPADNTNMIIQSYGSNTLAPESMFYMNKDGQIVQKVSGKVIVPFGGSATPIAGTRLVLFGYGTNTTAKETIFRFSSSGQLIHNSSNLYVLPASATNGALLTLSTTNSNDSIFSFT